MLLNMLCLIFTSFLVSTIILKYMDLSCPDICEWAQTALKVLGVYVGVSMIVFLFDRNYRTFLKRLYKSITILSH